MAKRVTLKAFPSVKLAVHGLGRYRTISTVREAAETLMERWPSHEGAAFEDALQACLKVMEGGGTPEAVREALIRAAREADIDVRD